MKNKKVNIRVGYTKRSLASYTYWERKLLAGVDVTIIDGKGNKIVIGSRECGSKVVVNNMTFFDQ